uniref:Uncharacterized protein n=1 Tax=Opuntia streptacantha TaxID=393608 RepID=A0A7C8Z5A1_OPUST
MPIDCFHRFSQIWVPISARARTNGKWVRDPCDHVDHNVSLIQYHIERVLHPKRPVYLLLAYKENKGGIYQSIWDPNLIKNSIHPNIDSTYCRFIYPYDRRSPAKYKKGNGFLGSAKTQLPTVLQDYDFDNHGLPRH